MKEVKIQNAETMQSYFTRVSQIKENVEAVEEEVENAEVVIATSLEEFWGLKWAS